MSNEGRIQPDFHAEWPFFTLRDYLAYLEKNDRLLHVDVPVDANLEIGGLSRRLMEEGSDKACMFWNTTSSFEGWHVESPFQVSVEVAIGISKCSRTYLMFPESIFSKIGSKN